MITIMLKKGGGNYAMEAITWANTVIDLNVEVPALYSKCQRSVALMAMVV
jgi:hypothetical protein